MAKRLPTTRQRRFRSAIVSASVLGFLPLLSLMKPAADDGTDVAVLADANVAEVAPTAPDAAAAPAATATTPASTSTPATTTNATPAQAQASRSANSYSRSKAS